MPDPARNNQTTQDFKVLVYEEPNGSRHISRTQSMMVWRKHFGAEKFRTFKPRLTETGTCEFCNGWGELNTRQFGLVRCICSIKETETELNIANHPYRGVYRQVKLDTLKEWGTAESKKSISDLLDAAQAFDDWPNHWLTIAGVPGTGKSHVLQWLAGRYSAWAIYMTDTEFNGQVFSQLDGEGGGLNAFLDALKTVPVLLYDDLGSGYNANFPLAQLRSVIDYRYRMPYEYITAVTTNLKPHELVELDKRIADRVQDVDLVKKVALDHVLSWRTRK